MIATEKSKHLRLFIAVDMPEEVVVQIRHIQQHFQHKSLFKGTYTKIDGVHITMKFLGDVPECLIPEIDNALNSITLPTIQASTGNLDVFASRHIIKILFLNVIAPHLTILAQQIDQALMPWFEPEKRPFVSHTTIARIKAVPDAQKFLAEVNHFSVPKINFIIDHFTLKQSVLDKTGPVYTDIKRYELL